MGNGNAPIGLGSGGATMSEWKNTTRIWAPSFWKRFGMAWSLLRSGRYEFSMYYRFEEDGMAMYIDDEALVPLPKDEIL
jgi:hypothetical protein